MNRLSDILMPALWSAFLVACGMELLVFALFDPEELHWAGHTLDWSRQTVYTLGFFVFWVIAGVGCFITGLLCISDTFQE